jgi:hypothetical protein
MVNRPRLKSLPGKKSTIRAAKTHDEWQSLMRSAIDLAEKTKDPRLSGLMAANAEGRVEQYLRRQGIICPVDLQREFPTKKT